MRNLAILAAILSIAVCAQAGVFISVNSAPGPAEVTIDVNSSLTLGIISSTLAQDSGGQYFIAMLTGGQASFDISQAYFPYPFLFKNIDLIYDPEIFTPGLQNPMIYVMAEGMPPYPPTLFEQRIVDGITLTCEGAGDVTLYLLDFDGNLLDTQLIHQVPEPMTIGLLGLGAMILRRKRPV